MMKLHNLSLKVTVIWTPGSKIEVIDVVSDEAVKKKYKAEPLPESFARNLDTIEKAREWLTNPNHWTDTEIVILTWVGLIPFVNRHHGERLLNEPWDNGIPWVVVTEQKRRRSKKERGETLDEPDLCPPEASDI